MSNIKITVRGSLLHDPVELRCVAANNNHVTQISERLAHQLGLIENTRGVYVSDLFAISGSSPIKWRIATSPMIITGLPDGIQQRSYVVYPVINISNAFYEIILGHDCYQQNYELLTYAINDRLSFQQGLKASPGPNYREDVHFMGHNILLTPYEEIPVMDEYLEFPTQGSRSVRRIAFNRVTRLLICVYRSSDVIYCYHQLPPHLQKQIENGASRGKTMTAVKEACAVETIASCCQFPDIVLVNPLNAIVM